jgi:multidrug efflux system membrane fusion protein
MRGGAVPVLVAAAARADLPLYLTGLGTVTPSATVTVRSRVDGQLLSVAFAEGQTVQAGALLAEIDPRPFAALLKQAEGQLAKDQALLKNARLDLERYRAGGAIFTTQQLDTQGATVEQLQGVVDTDQGQVDSARLQLSYCRITAPIGGRIGLLAVDPGNLVHASDQAGIAVLTTLQPIGVVFTISQDEIPRLLQRTRAEPGLVVEAYGRDLAQRLATGTLAAIDNQVDPGSGTVRLKADFANQDGALFPNQFVNARLLIDTLRGVVLVPTPAVQRAPDRSFVFVAGSDGTVSVRTVTVGPSEGGRTVVDGVEDGESVVIDGVDKLHDGSKVTARRADHEDGTAPAGERRKRGGKHGGDAGKRDGADPGKRDGADAAGRDGGDAGKHDGAGGGRTGGPAP